jgi:hypothetical protein
VAVAPRSRAVGPTDGRERLTFNRETDARTALFRGLKEYLADLEIEVQPGGRVVSFQRAYDAWAEYEKTAEYPALVVYGVEEEAAYDASRLTPGVIRLPDGTVLSSGAELVVTLAVDATATDPEERVAICAMVEDAWNPDPDHARHGARLELPHYHGARASFTPLGVKYLDDEVSAARKIRRVVWRVRAAVALLRVVQFPLAKPGVNVASVS